MTTEKKSRKLHEGDLYFLGLQHYLKNTKHIPMNSDGSYIVYDIPNYDDFSVMLSERIDEILKNDEHRLSKVLATSEAIKEVVAAIIARRVGTVVPICENCNQPIVEVSVRRTTMELQDTFYKIDDNGRVVQTSDDIDVDDDGLEYFCGSCEEYPGDTFYDWFRDKQDEADKVAMGVQAKEGEQK